MNTIWKDDACYKYCRKKVLTFRRHLASNLVTEGLSVFNPCPAEPGYTLPLQTVQIQISWLLKKPTDLDLHFLPLRM